MKTLPGTLLLGLLTTPVSGQAQPGNKVGPMQPGLIQKGQAKKKPEKPFSKPFRFAAPTVDLELDDKVRRILRDIYTLQQRWSTAKDRGFDERGRPTTSLKHFKELKTSIVKRFEHGTASLLAWAIREDRSSARRRACFFAGLLAPDAQNAMHLCYYLPYEPISSVRREATRNAMTLIRRHLPQRNDDNSGYRYVFDAKPWIDLTRSSINTDRIQAFGVLELLAKARPRMGAYTARVMRKWLPDLLRSKNERLTKAARAFLTQLLPDARFPDHPAQHVAYYEHILNRLFPDIRLRGGYCEIYPGADRTQIITVGKQHMRRQRLGQMVSITVPSKLGPKHAQGLKLFPIPKPLDKLGLLQGDILTTLNGMPIEGNQPLLRQIEELLEAKVTSFVLEWVRKKEFHARRYVLRKHEDG